MTSTTIILHLVSHASGELIEMLARNAVAQFEGIKVERRLWKFVRHMGQVPEILAAIAETRGFVLHSIAALDLRNALEEGCRRLRVPCQFSLEPVIGALAKHYDLTVRYQTSARDLIDEEYYRRIEAMKFTLSHDDGLATEDLDDADVVLVGVSRATKTPTCMYLASCGVKAANVPLVPGSPLPVGLLRAKRPLIVGLTVNPSRLLMIRADRLKALGEVGSTTYADEDALRKEVQAAQRLFFRHGWPIIDVTSRSIEQTATMIIDRLKHRAASG